MNAHVCSVCGMVKTETEGWFLLAENRWQDRLKILNWDDDLAKHDFVFSVCGADHVRDFLHKWVTSSELLSPSKKAFSSPLERISREIPSVGNLWVHRHGLKNTPEGLKSLLDAVIGSLQSDSGIQKDQLPSRIGPQRISFQTVAARAS